MINSFNIKLFMSILNLYANKYLHTLLCIHILLKKNKINLLLLHKIQNKVLRKIPMHYKNHISVHFRISFTLTFNTSLQVVLGQNYPKKQSGNIKFKRRPYFKNARENIARKCENYYQKIILLVSLQTLKMIISNLIALQWF